MYTFLQPEWLSISLNPPDGVRMRTVLPLQPLDQPRRFDESSRYDDRPSRYEDKPSRYEDRPSRFDDAPSNFDSREPAIPLSRARPRTQAEWAAFREEQKNQPLADIHNPASRRLKLGETSPFAFKYHCWVHLLPLLRFCAKRWLTIIFSCLADRWSQARLSHRPHQASTPGALHRTCRECPQPQGVQVQVHVGGGPGERDATSEGAFAFRTGHHVFWRFLTLRLLFAAQRDHNVFLEKPPKPERPPKKPRVSRPRKQTTDSDPATAEAGVVDSESAVPSDFSGGMELPSTSSSTTASESTTTSDLRFEAPLEGAAQGESFQVRSLLALLRF